LEAVRIPPLSDHNAWADFWYYEIGVNVVPAHTQKKKTFMEWKRWQTESIPEELHDQWKRENKFADGLAIILGKVWRGEHIGEYLIFIDCDNLKAIEEFCTKDGQTYSLKQVAEKYIVEQHPDDTNKAHIFFYSEIPFTKKSSDINVIGHLHKIKNEEVPAFEVKGQGTHGIAYCTPSVHKNGERYQIVGTARPVKLSEEAAHKMMEHIDAICRKYGLQYLENDNGNGNALVPIRDLFKEDFVIHEGHNRHLALLRVMDSLVKRNAGILSLEEVKELAYKWNQKHCSPPLDDVSFERQWKDATKYIVPTLESDSSRTTELSIEEKDEDDEDHEEEEKKRTAKAKKALELAIENSQELFVNEFGMAFAAVKVNGHVEVHPMDEQHFKNWISGIYYQRNDDLLSEEDLKKIVRILKAKAEFPSNGISRHRLDVRVRGYNKRQEEEKRFQDEYDNDSVGSDGGVNSSSVGCVGSSNDEITENFDAIYYDLTNKRWEAVKVTPEGWEIDKHPPILFRRYGSERPQPYPDRNYEPDIFDRFLDLVNLKTEPKTCKNSC
jgi:desulfoferrodoxin (superoxide reductase-like protein)